MSENAIEEVYGLFCNTGNGNEHYWHLGVYYSRDDAYEAWKHYLERGFWIDSIKIKKLQRYQVVIKSWETNEIVETATKEPVSKESAEELERETNKILDHTLYYTEIQ